MHGNEQGDILIKSVKGARRRIRALRSSARNKRPKQARKNQKRGTKRAGELPEREWTIEERESAYEEPWQLAKSLGPVPGENYSRYEFTGGAGLQGERSTVEERWGGRVQRIADSRVSELPDKARVVVGLNKLRNPSGEPA